MAKKASRRYKASQEIGLYYGGSLTPRITKQDTPEEIAEMSGEIGHHIQKDVRREQRASRTMRSRIRSARDHCGATRHVSKRNEGRKPRSKAHR